MIADGLPELPVGCHLFEELRLRDAVYVDKTKYLPMLGNTGKFIFCARPRRFGKSLTVTALDAFYSGRIDLFRGLTAEKVMDATDFVARPVIRLDMSSVAGAGSKRVLEKKIMCQLGVSSKRHGVTLRGADSADAFLLLLIDVHESTAKKVVVLIDEFDSPVISVIQRKNPAYAEQLDDTRNVMRSFYLRIKTADEHIESAFITGVTRFSRMGVFSTLNNLIDISLEPEFGAFMGFTQDELENNFKEFITKTANELGKSEKRLLRMIKDYYNGFSFDGKTRLYNPFSILSFLHAKIFKNYWIKSESKTLIRKFLNDNSVTVEQFHGKVVDDDFASDPGEIDDTPPEGFLYQAGYLTLRYRNHTEFTLDYPNREVRLSLSTLFFENISPSTAWLDIRKYGRDLTRHLASGDVKGMVGIFTRLLSSIIYYDHADANREQRVMTMVDGAQETADEGSPKEPSRETPRVLAEKLLRTMGEGFYRSILHAGLWMAGALVTAEKGENIDRSDLEAVYGRYPYIIELKMTEDVTGGEKAVKAGMVQIDEKGYGRSYKDPILVSLAIGRKERNIVACLFKSGESGSVKAVEIKLPGKQ
ncbi:MAG: ATP-binding protein [Deltaproteobacteria bacterium]|jgi:hypothetical protein|nr:ATP-binding protein [Deltaproteobacteria bacterium]